MFEGVYGDVYSKVSLCLVGSQVAKQSLVSEFGVGEDLPFTFFAWRGGVLVGVFSFGPGLMGLSVVDRLPFVERVGGVCRGVLGADGVSFVGEGFLRVGGGVGGLREGFVSGGGVDECVCVCHVSLGGLGGVEFFLVSVPFWYLPGRVVVWGDELGWVSGVGGVLSDVVVLEVLGGCLGGGVGVFSVDEVGEVLEGLVGVGVNVELFGV